ncbi:MAG: PLP-dependent aminotransferase family protein [Solirubrobacterales bacterium]|nr:PLP-dependent aminotransferase family protein [Solirubrobacterales bacterium]MBV9166797.1 PLP-dependent aminotransferase family protein [Solirubrobacterales bacterium]
MSVEWAGVGPEVLLRLDRSASEPLRVQLERGLREAIRSGRLEAGERLPSSRAMAAELGISRGLVLECYSQLQAEGFLTSRSGSATRVAAGALAPAELPVQPPPLARPIVDFRPGVPDLTSFPRRDWVWALREGSRGATPLELGYGDPRGVQFLRVVLAGYLRRVRGAVADAERVVVCGGFAQGINLVLGALSRRGTGRVAIEDPGDVDYLAICERLGIRAVPVRIDKRGIDVEALAAAEVGAVILTPTHQFPTGTALASERRQALVAWAQACGAMIIEDDYDAEFRYDRDPVGALQGLAPDRVALIGTVSKSLAPGLRLGWVVCPPDILEPLIEEKRLSDRGSPALEQLALAILMESGRFDRQVRRMRQVYGSRRDTLVRALSTGAPAVVLHGLAAGFHAVADLAAEADEQAIVEQARERSVGLYGMSSFRPSGGGGAPQLVLGFGNLSQTAIERGIAAVADLL